MIRKVSDQTGLSRVSMPRPYIDTEHFSNATPCKCTKSAHQPGQLNEELVVNEWDAQVVVAH
eukprot:1821866-Amphidinium_carterae.2